MLEVETFLNGKKFNPGLTLSGFQTTRPCSLILIFVYIDVAVVVAVTVFLNSRVALFLGRHKLLAEKKAHISSSLQRESSP